MEQIENDIRPEDFKEDSVWRELVKACGPKPALIISRFYGGNRLYIPTQDTIMEEARKRYYKKSKLYKSSI